MPLYNTGTAMIATIVILTLQIFEYNFSNTYGVCSVCMYGLQLHYCRKGFIYKYSQTTSQPPQQVRIL